MASGFRLQASGRTTQSTFPEDRGLRIAPHRALCAPHSAHRTPHPTRSSYNRRVILIGTSGYNYPEWKGSFYPADLPAAKMLLYYAARFPTVEINYTFYRMPNEKRS